MIQSNRYQIICGRSCQTEEGALKIGLIACRLTQAYNGRHVSDGKTPWCQPGRDSERSEGSEVVFLGVSSKMLKASDDSRQLLRRTISGSLLKVMLYIPSGRVHAR